MSKSISICTVDGCINAKRSPGSAYCGTHYQRLRLTGSVQADNPIVPHQQHDPNTPPYRTVHKWLQNERGRADEHDCVRCGRPARHWAYDHSDPDERVGSDGRTFSNDLSRYQPMCQTCHQQWDRERTPERFQTDAIADRKRQTACKHGHEFTPENTRIDKNGWRSCRTCKREWDQNHSKRRRSQ